MQRCENESLTSPQPTSTAHVSTLRDTHLQHLANDRFDVLIVGAGINGACAAAALASKGVSVALIDRSDFASATSQQSSNLAWGGIKYMESFDFSLVRKLCKSRNHLVKSFPSSVKEIRFLTTVSKGFRHHPGMLWAGSWLYWLMGNGQTRMPRFLRISDIHKRASIVDTREAHGGVEYSDAYLYDNDARFVFQFVHRAMHANARVANYVESLGAEHHDEGWKVRVRDVIHDRPFTIQAKVLINAAGPWVDEHNRLSGETTEHHHAFSKGIHLIVPKLTDDTHVLAFFADDGRLFFVIPMGNRTCIGTTDTRVEHPHVDIDAGDINFVLDNINKRLTLARPLNRDDIIATRCGVRPLAVSSSNGKERDFLQLSRKHAIDTNRKHAHISIFGGKLTDCINVGEEILAEVQKLGIDVPHPESRWYGEPGEQEKQEFLRHAMEIGLDGLTPEDASEPLSQRLWRRYANDAHGLLESIVRDPRQAEPLIEGSEYLRCELQLAREQEMVTRLEDLLRRRDRISLVVSQEQLRHSPGLHEACEILFGDQAEARYAEYFGTSTIVTQGLS